VQFMHIAFRIHWGGGLIVSFEIDEHVCRLWIGDYLTLSIGGVRFIEMVGFDLSNVLIAHVGANK